MKVLVTSTWLPPISGGAEQVAWETAKRLAKKKGIKVSVLTTGEFGKKKIEGVTVYSTPYLKPLSLVYSSFLGRLLINKLLKNEKFDVVHCHIPLPWAFVLKDYPAKKIITFHGFETGLHNPHPLMFFMEKRLTELAIKKFDEFTVPSNSFKKEIDNFYGIKAKKILNGTNTKKFRPIKNIKQEKKVILFVGRYIELKGIREILEVAKELPQYKFWFVGKGPLENEIKGENVKNLGFKTQEELVKIYNRATIGVFPSYHESFGITALEAMSCGKAVITTKLGFSEFISNKKEGIIITPRNKKMLKTEIINLIENKPLRKILEKNARKKALKLDWKEIANKYYRIYLK